jgi:hypothetical protein
MKKADSLYGEASTFILDRPKLPLHHLLSGFSILLAYAFFGKMLAMAGSNHNR